MTNAVNLASAAGTGFFRNRIINGEMRTDQRFGGASVTPGSGYTYTLDRWAVETTQASKFTVQQNAGGVTPPAGFTTYLGITSTSAYSLTSTDQFTVGQGIEGTNIYDWGWGTANAVPVTLSFWVRASIPGTYGGTFTNNGASRNYVFSYTVNAANTWEYKTITVPGDTTGTWVTNTTAAGVYVRFCIAAGSSTQASVGWTGSLVRTVIGQTNVLGTNGATLYLTGVQVEVGSVATPFERRPYGQELALCQRYYQTYPNTITYRATPFSSSFAVRQTGMFCVPMRAAPSVTVTTSGIGNQGTTTNVIGVFTSHVQFEAVTPNSSAWGNPHYDVAYNASAEL